MCILAIELLISLKYKNSNSEVTGKRVRHGTLEANPYLHWHIQWYFPEQLNIKIMWDNLNTYMTDTV